MPLNKEVFSRWNSRFYCAADGCINRNNKDPRKDPSIVVRYFTFPTDECRRLLWAKRCKMKKEKFDRMTTQNVCRYRLCGLHFDVSQFTTPLRTRLNKGSAIPSIFGDEVYDVPTAREVFAWVEREKRKLKGLSDISVNTNLSTPSNNVNQTGPSLQVGNIGNIQQVEDSAAVDIPSCDSETIIEITTTPYFMTSNVNQTELSQQVGNIGNIQQVEDSAAVDIPNCDSDTIIEITTTPYFVTSNVNQTRPSQQVGNIGNIQQVVDSAAVDIPNCDSDTIIEVTTTPYFVTSKPRKVGQPSEAPNRPTTILYNTDPIHDRLSANDSPVLVSRLSPAQSVPGVKKQQLNVCTNQPPIKPKSVPDVKKQQLNVRTKQPKKKTKDWTVQQTEPVYPVNREMLAAKSPVLAALFDDQNALQVIDTDLNDNVLCEILRFVHTGKTGLVRNMVDLLIAAEKYAITDLFTFCQNRIFFTVDNVAELLILADKHNAELLKSRAIDFINCNTVAVMMTSGWNVIVKTHPQLLALLYQAKAAQFTTSQDSPNNTK